MNLTLRKIVKYILICATMIFLSSRAYASKPVVGISGINSPGSVTLNINRQIEDHLVNILGSTRLFSIVNTALMKDQLNKYGCTEEKCILSFARTAGIDVIISGYLDQGPDFVFLTLNSYGIKAPHFGKSIYKYTVKIPVSGLNQNAEFITEEHAGWFISGLLARYKALVFLNSNEQGNWYIDSSYYHSGTFKLYRFDGKIPGDVSIKLYDEIGEVTVENNKILDIESSSPVMENDFIFAVYHERAGFIRNFYRGRKEELVFAGTTFKEDFLLFISTPLSSAVMPVVAPLSYYKYEDYTGMLLWAINAAPYFYIEYNGLTNRPDKLKEDNKDVTKRTLTDYRFGVYMLVCGGMSLVVDSFAHRQLSLASDYYPQPSLGNEFSAAYLSLVSGGGGHFYRGYRLWGYLYFHLNNVLLYALLREYSPAEKYDPLSKTYKKDDIDKKTAYSYMAAFGLLKIIDITHAVLRDDNVRNGELIEEDFTFEPEIHFNDGTGMNFGLKFSYKWQ